MTTKHTIETLAKASRMNSSDMLSFAHSAGVKISSSDEELNPQQIDLILNHLQKKRSSDSGKKTLSLSASSRSKPSRSSISSNATSQSGNISVVRKRKISEIPQPRSVTQTQQTENSVHNTRQPYALDNKESKKTSEQKPHERAIADDKNQLNASKAKQSKPSSVANATVTIQKITPSSVPKNDQASHTKTSLALENATTKKDTPIATKHQSSPSKTVSEANDYIDIKNRRNKPIRRGAVVDLTAKLQAKKPKVSAKDLQKPSNIEKKTSDTEIQKTHQTNKIKPIVKTNKTELETPKDKKPVVKTIRASDKKSRRSGGKTTRQPNELATEELQLNEYQRRRNSETGEKRVEPLTTTLLTQNFIQPDRNQSKVLEIGENIQVGELAHQLGIKTGTLIKELMKQKIMASVNQNIDFDTAELIADHFGHTISQKKHVALEQQVTGDSSNYHMYPRAPVITVMGHVDHGKTSLLDFIRSTKVVQSESGGITQHIGAYQIHTPKGAITFIDTPGHAAFTAMRARGAQVTDIVVLVVACDDKVMPQTIEAIQHARSADAPIVVALNKIDLPESDPERLINELAAQELVPEEWGGDIQYIKVSAHTGEGIDTLLEAIHLQAEILELTARVDGTAKGVVVESWLDKNRGSLATILVKESTLSVGQYIIAGSTFGRIRAMHDSLGNSVNKALPSMPVELLGLNETPESGDVLIEVANERAAKELIAERLEDRKRKSQPKRVIIDDPFSDAPASKVLYLVIKADTQGSLGAIMHALGELQTDALSLQITLSGVGGITESDVSIAHATGARIIGFNVRSEKNAQSYAEKEQLDIKYYSIIYELIEEIDNTLHGLLDPIIEEKILGIAEVRDVFSVSKFGKIAGSMVTEGIIFRNKPIRVLRDNVVIYEGELESLKRFKDDAREVRHGMECGIGVKNYRDVRAGDKIEVFDRIEKRPQRTRRNAKQSTE